MSVPSYLNFELHIEEQDNSTFCARVIKSPVGQAKNDFTLPISKQEIADFFLRIKQLDHHVDSVDFSAEDEIRALGAKLYNAVFDTEVAKSLGRSIDAANNERKGLRLLIKLPTSLLNLPWEFLYDSTKSSFFSLSTSTPIVRYLELPQPPIPLAVKPPLNVLVMIAGPNDQKAIHIEREWAKIKAATEELTAQDLIKLTLIPTASLSALQKQLRQEDYHIFHFIGRSGFQPETQSDIPLLEDENSDSHPVTGEKLATLLHDHSSIRLTLLDTRGGPSTKIAQQLVLQGIPAVIAMQFEVRNNVADNLIREFYSALADGYPVDAALAEARKAVSTISEFEWGAPVLYLRSSDSHLFDIDITSTSSIEKQVNLRNSLLNRLKAESTGRCVARWQALGLTREEARELTDDSAIGSIREEYETSLERPVVVLTAEMGTGKSLILERLYQRALERSIAQPNAPIPIYVEEASECDNGKLINYLTGHWRKRDASERKRSLRRRTRASGHVGKRCIPKPVCQVS